MRMARASQDEIDRLIDFFNMLEEVIEQGTYTNDSNEPKEIDEADAMELIRKSWDQDHAGVGSSWRRVVFGCDVLIKNCCDPEVSHLEWRKDIREWLESQTARAEVESSNP